MDLQVWKMSHALNIAQPFPSGTANVKPTSLSRHYYLFFPISTTSLEKKQKQNKILKYWDLPIKSRFKWAEFGHSTGPKSAWKHHDHGSSLNLKKKRFRWTVICTGESIVLWNILTKGATFEDATDGDDDNYSTIHVRILQCIDPPGAKSNVI